MFEDLDEFLEGALGDAGAATPATPTWLQALQSLPGLATGGANLANAIQGKPTPAATPTAPQKPAGGGKGSSSSSGAGAWLSSNWPYVAGAAVLVGGVALARRRRRR